MQVFSQPPGIDMVRLVHNLVVILIIDLDIRNGHRGIKEAYQQYALCIAWMTCLSFIEHRLGELLTHLMTKSLHYYRIHHHQ
jgi:hypothetical protein